MPRKPKTASGADGNSSAHPKSNCLGLRESVEQLGVAIRAGLHAGECETMGEDIGGIAVHIGARVAAEAAGGEVLVSSTVKDLVAGSGLEFEERGSHRLKGVPDEWRLFAVTGGV